MVYSVEIFVEGVPRFKWSFSSAVMYCNVKSWTSQGPLHHDWFKIYEALVVVLVNMG